MDRKAISLVSASTGKNWNWKGDAGGRRVFRRYQEKAVFYEVSLEKELEDIDYMPEIEKMRITEGGTEKELSMYMSSKMEASKEESL